MNYILYLIENKINGKKYIGQTRRYLSVRITQHIKDACSGCNYILHRAIRKYGYENFKVKTLLKNIPENKIDYYEKLWITKLNTFYVGGNGYNQTLGGQGTHGYVFSEEARRKIAITSRHPCSLSRRTKISNSLKGIKFTEEHKRNISKAMLNKKGELNNFYGRNHTIESKNKISLANGKPINMIDIKTNKVIKEFNSVLKAVNWLLENNITKNKSAHVRIFRVCNNEWDAKTAYGYKWEYIKKV